MVSYVAFLVLKFHEPEQNCHRRFYVWESTMFPQLLHHEGRVSDLAEDSA